MKAAFKWRLQNGIYGYLIDEDNQNGPFAYDISDRSRIYPDGTIETGATVNEGEISTTVSKFSRNEYINAFSSFKSFINASYPQVSLLDVMYYYNIENDECTASASSLKCSATDIIFDATAVEGSELSVVVTNEQTDPKTREALRYRLDFTFPNTTPSGVEYTAGDNIDITTGNTISALGYRYDQDKDSIAVGSGSVGLGMYSHAEGYGTQANGEASHAEGKSTQANGPISHVEGEGTNAKAWCAHAEGHMSIAEGNSSHAEGIGTSTNNEGEHAEGLYNKSNTSTDASGRTIHSIGIGSEGNNKNAFEVMQNGNVYLYSVGNYDGTNATEGTTKTLQEVLGDLNNSGSSSGITYVGGNNIEITDNTITALGYVYDETKHSVAEGENTQANGNASHAEGYETIASGVASHAEGAKYDNNRKTESAGQASHAEGASTYAKADGSHAEGILNIAGRFLDEIKTAAQELGISGTPQELVAKLLGYGAHVEGMNNNALGSCSHSEGNATKALANATHAEGDTTIAFGEASHAEGYNTQAKGNQSHAEGSSTTATGNSAHAEGVSTVASGSFSHAEGSHTESTGRDSHAEGAYNKAIGIASHAEGEHTIAYGDYSHVEGEGTITNNVGEHAEGKYNHSNSDTEGTNNIGLNTIHSIGIGNDESDRKNAFEVMENGDIYVYNVGTYDGTNATDSAKTLQDVLRELNNGGGSGSGITYVGGNNIDITDNTITAKGYTYNNVNNTETLELDDNILSLGGGNTTIHYDVDERQTTFTNINGLNVTADGEMSITNISSNINITASKGDMNISSKNGIDITATAGDINITTSNSHNFSVDSSSFSSTCPITAEVNGVENVYLGCPIGTIVMWAGQTAPDGWFLCDGTPIPVNKLETVYKTLSCKIHSKEFSEGELNFFAFEILSTNGNANFGNATLKRYNNHWIKSGEWVNNYTGFNVTAWTDDCYDAYKFYSEIQIYFNRQDITANIEDYFSILMPNLQQKFPLGAMQGGTIGSSYATDLGNTGGEDMHTLTEDEMPRHSHTLHYGSSNGGVPTAEGYYIGNSGWGDTSSKRSDGSDGVPYVEEAGGNQSHNNIPPFLAINFIIKYK